VKVLCGCSVHRKLLLQNIVSNPLIGDNLSLCGEYFYSHGLIHLVVAWYFATAENCVL